MKQELQVSAASSAVLASGAGTALTSLLDTLSSGATPSTATITSLVATIKSGASADVVTALSYLDPSTVSSSAASGTLGATDYAIAAVVIAASALPADVTDPTTMTSTQLASFQAEPAVVTATSILTEASTLVVAGSSSAALLDSLTSNFSLPTS